MLEPYKRLRSVRRWQSIRKIYATLISVTFLAVLQYQLLNTNLKGGIWRNKGIVKSRQIIQVTFNAEMARLDNDFCDIILWDESGLTLKQQSCNSQETTPMLGSPQKCLHQTQNHQREQVRQLPQISNADDKRFRQDYENVKSIAEMNMTASSDGKSINLANVIS